MRKRTNWGRIIGIIIVAIISLALMIFVNRGILPESLDKWSGIIGWLVFCVVAIVGGFIVGKITKRR